MERPIVFLGDSHIGYFRYASNHGMLGTRPCGFCEVGGATAVGLRNPNSSKNALSIFRDYLSKAIHNPIVVIQLGEVDCGFVIWYRSNKYGESIIKQMIESIDTYFTFVDSLLSNGITTVITTGAVLPTIRNGIDFGEVANLRVEVTASIEERTLLTCLYNIELRSNAIARGLHYIDITDNILDLNTGLVKDYFRNPDPCDHHLNYERAARCWADRLNVILTQGDCQSPADDGQAKPGKILQRFADILRRVRGRLRVYSLLTTLY